MVEERDGRWPPCPGRWAGGRGDVAATHPYRVCTIPIPQFLGVVVGVLSSSYCLVLFLVEFNFKKDVVYEVFTHSNQNLYQIYIINKIYSTTYN